MVPDAKLSITPPVRPLPGDERLSSILAYGSAETLRIDRGLRGRLRNLHDRCIGERRLGPGLVSSGNRASRGLYYYLLSVRRGES